MAGNTQETYSTTIFDDVFRTMLERMPSLFIPLINEVFGTGYPLDAETIQLKNEHVTGSSKRITDSYMEVSSIGIEDGRYHIECQSSPDGNIIVRMVEYDFFIALENHSAKGGILEMEFPKSCVLYLRHNASTREKESLRIKFPDGQDVLYTVPIIRVQEYGMEEIFRKKLFVLLPYYIMRYEKMFQEIDGDKDKTDRMLREYAQILDRLDEFLAREHLYSIYSYLLDYISQIAGYMLRNTEYLKERVGDFMGGKILTTRTDEILNKGMEQGRNIEKSDTVLRLHKQNLPISIIAAGVGMDEDAVRKIIGK